VTALREAIRLQPSFAGAHITLATVLRQLGDTEEAAAESKAGARACQAENQRASRPVLHHSGRRLLQAGDVEGAISQFRAAINSPLTLPRRIFNWAWRCASKARSKKRERNSNRL